MDRATVKKIIIIAALVVGAIVAVSLIKKGGTAKASTAPAE